tara:strand:+ start:44 stop:448 length:405 start_codon:yes stop_codon:yes gene_type:complete
MEIPNKIKILDVPRISHPKGDLRKIVDVNSAAFRGFGEVYLSEIASGERKGWKRHNEMHMTLFVISGKIRFVFKEEIEDSKAYFTKILTETDNCLLSVTPGLWFMFEGLSFPKSILLNFANIPHSDAEVDRCDL